MTAMTDLLTSPSLAHSLLGVTIGIVTNNKDPDGLGRIKIKFPWLSEAEESSWARVVTLMAGNDRGLYFLPEVDDEVLVAFDHGDMALPYILGALWNGEDKPPVTNDDGENNQRLIKSRSGHQIVLDDTEGAEQIQIVDGSGENSMTISMKDNSIAIEAKGDITLKASGAVDINDGKQGAARQNDPVEVIIPSGSFITQVSGGSGAPAVGVPNPVPVTVQGKIKAASGTVKIGG